MSGLPLPIREAEWYQNVKVERGPRTAPVIQSVGAGLPTQAQDQCDCDGPGTCDWEGTGDGGR